MSFDNSQSGNQKRRDFIRNAIIAGSAVAGASAFMAFQQEGAQETGEKVKLLSPEGEIVEIDSGYLKPIPAMHHHHEHISKEAARKGIPNRRFVMVIDLARCKNLRKCHDACENMHHLPDEKEWLKVLKIEDNALASPHWQPTMCYHCDEPPCVKVCPVDATFKREDGLVLVDTDRCIGCRFCMVACPYSARTFDWSEPDITEEMAQMPYSPETSSPPKMGTVSKCDFCPHMIRDGLLPSCVTACPNGVFYFGDEYEDAVTNGDETVKLSQLLRDKSGYRYLEDLGTKPRVYYLPPVNRLFPFEDDEFTKPEADL